MRLIAFGWLAASVALSAATMARAADAERGADVFDSNCAECHSVAKSMKNKKGPSLFGVAGRTAASVNGFDYSDAMRSAGFAWDTQHLDQYLSNPRALIPGGKMKFDGLSKADERADLIAFLEQQK